MPTTSQIASNPDRQAAWQTHQQPAAHVGGLRGQRRDPAAELATAQDEVAERRRAPVGDEPEQQADGHVGHEARDDRGVVFDHEPTRVVAPDKGDASL
jgi:hypothetical protein